ncbi:MAG: hypothetical protein JW882_05165 [Deltaproteobacteria bacterium]|nr:hypothetical protein [Deltaproteobacteria bacterium]
MIKCREETEQVREGRVPEEGPVKAEDRAGAVADKAAEVVLLPVREDIAFAPIVVNDPAIS